MEQLSRRHAWVSRVAAWDAETQRIKRESHVREIEALARREVLAGRLFQTRGLERVRGLADRDVAALTISEAIRLVVVGARMEREGLGVDDLELRDLAPPPEPPTADMGAHAAIVEILRRNPSRCGPVVTALSSLRDALAGIGPPDTSPTGDVAASCEPDSALGDRLWDDVDREAPSPRVRQGRYDETVCSDPPDSTIDPALQPPTRPSPWILGVSVRRRNRGRRRRSTVPG